MDAVALRRVYGRVAERYAVAFSDELAGKPLDRRLLDEFAARCRDIGPVLDVGCGPGHVARYLHDRGVDAAGVDLAPEMIAVASQRNPGLRFSVGDLTELAAADHALAGIVAFYSLIHLPRNGLPDAVRELHRALRPGGVLLVAVHAGIGGVHTDEFLGEAVSVDATLFAADELMSVVSGCGFTVDEILERPPYHFEHPTTRLYVLATADGA